MNQYFIAGTDTDAGKTFVSQILMQAFNRKGRRCIGFKPISAGCEETPAGLRNSDALLLQALSEPKPEYELVNPVAYRAPVAPHLAAVSEQMPLDMNKVESAYEQLKTLNSDVLLVEGAGGWRLPLGDQAYLSDFPKKHNMPVILVVGLKLGCLNHACLTAESILADGLTLAGWVANEIDPHMGLKEENVNSLKQMIPAPFLGRVPRLQSPSDGVAHLDLALL